MNSRLIPADCGDLELLGPNALSPDLDRACGTISQAFLALAV